MSSPRLSHAAVKHIRSLHRRKFRQRYGQFIAEGVKVVRDLAQGGMVCDRLVVTEGVEPPLAALAAEVVDARTMARISTLATPPGVLAVFQAPDPVRDLSDRLVAVDGWRDPGNLGTLVRAMDWFGWSMLIVSPDTVDIHNPKVVQATMGSLARVHVVERDLSDLASTGHVLLGADMEGVPCGRRPDDERIALVLGSESHGLSPAVRRLLNEVVSVPRVGGGESLNAAVSAAILLDRLNGR